MNRLAVISILFLLATGCSQHRDPLDVLRNGQWLDLTWSFDEHSVYWPTNIPFSHDTVFAGINDKGYYYSSYKFSAEEHGGTHFDAPIHFAQGGNSVEKVPVEQLTGEGIVVDVSTKVASNSDYLITATDLQDWEKQHGRIPDDAIILLRTGFGKFYPDKETYTGTLLAGTEGVAHLHFPGLHPDAAQWLVTNRKIKAVGLDTPSIDYGQSQDFMTHRTLYAAGLTAYENLANLEKLPPKGFWIMAFPMKIKGGSGAPLRIVALLP
ncbi:MAG: cyclase family protein [Bacteroidales bacterium]|nr:cyclase family protein [Lentimicrobiaceae bacterium]MDD5694895.1 cyclase family protein [Bacteroidales bacterium]